MSFAVVRRRLAPFFQVEALMDTLAQDVTFAFRRLRGTPGFTLVAALTLALGLAATTTMFSVIDATLLRPLPYRDPASLVRVWAERGRGSSVPYVPHAAFVEWRSHRDLFAGVEAFGTRTPTLTDGREPTQAIACAVTGGMMEMLGAVPRLGRLISPDDAASERRVTVLSDALWRTRFGGDPRVVGRRIDLDGKPFEIVGVATPAFRFPAARHQLWIPMVPSAPSGRPLPSVEVLARLRAGLTIEQANARAATVGAALEQARPSPSGWRILVRPFLDTRVSPAARRALVVLFGAVVLVLLVACANLANLLLAQGAHRQQELATRSALGGTPLRLVRQLMVENLLLAAIGGILGVMLSAWTVTLLVAVVPTDLTFLNVADIALERRAVVFAVVSTLATVLLFGAVPALRTVRIPLSAGGTANRTVAGGHTRAQAAFVVVQVALSLVLLVGAGLLLRTFLHLTRVDTGFDEHHLVAIDLSLPRWKYATFQAQSDLLERMVARLRAVPGAESATVTTGIPPDDVAFSFGLRIEGEGSNLVIDDKELLLPFTEVQADFFRVMRIPIRQGRAFSSADAVGATPAIMVSEQLARRLWPGGQAVGRRIRLDRDSPWYTIVGVAGDVFQMEYAAPSRRLAVYYPLSQATRLASQQTLVVRTIGDASNMLPIIRQAIWSVDRDQPISKIATVTQLYREFFALPRFYATVLSAFAALGLVLAAVGLYGVLAYSMARRTREFGVRLALGATPRTVVDLLVRQAVWLTMAGLALGVAASLIVTRWLASMLVGVPRLDPVTYLVVAVTLLGTALAACWPTARRARRVDPMVALRYE